MGSLVITMAPVSGHVISGRGGPFAVSVLSIRVRANLIGASGMAETVPILRQWLLLKMLSARRQGVTLREMADETGCSQKTIRRDLLLLTRVGFPVDETTADHGRKHWRIAEPHGGPAMTFNWSEAIALYLGWRLLQPLAGTQFWEAANAAHGKIRATLGKEALRYVDKMTAAFHLTTVGASDYGDRADVIDQLSQAIEDHVTVWLGYRSERSTEPATREIHPYGWIHHKNSLYLVAWATERQSVRTYKADRIDSADITKLKFPRPAEFDLANYVAGSFGVYRGDGQPARRVRVRFLPAVVRYVSEKQWHPSQKLEPQRDGALLAEFELSSTEEVRAWLLSFGANAIVLEPADLRDSIQTELRRWLGLYDGQPTPAAKRRARKPR